MNETEELRARISKVEAKLREVERERDKWEGHARSLDHDVTRWAGRCQESEERAEKAVRERGAWKGTSLFGHIACDEHYQSHVGEFSDCPYCRADIAEAESERIWECIGSIIAHNMGGYKTVIDTIRAAREKWRKG